MKKKIKDLTVGEIKKICKKHYGNSNYSCRTCPLNYINLCACFASDWNDLYYEVEVDGSNFN